MTAKVPVEVKLTQISEMFRMCGLAPLSQQIKQYLEGELELPDEDLERIVAAGERFAKASRSVGLKELPYMDEPHKYADGEAEAGEAEQSGAEADESSDETEDAEGADKPGDSEPGEEGGAPDAEGDGDAGENSEEEAE